MITGGNVESLGERLKNARNEKGLSIEQISRDTNIAVRFLEALESENFGLFPGEPYLIGFLKIYSSYLELDVPRTITLYRALRIQEQPVPKDIYETLPKIPVFLFPVLIIIVILGAAGFGINHIIKNRQNNLANAIEQARTPMEYLMEGRLMERRLYINDSVSVRINSEVYKVELFNLSETVTIRTEAGGTEILDLSQEVTVDLNNDGVPKLRIMVADFAKNQPDMGALLHFYLMEVTTMAEIETEQEIPFVMSAPTTSITSIIPPSPNAYPFTLQINFQGYCMFRWEILNERDRRGVNQRFFQRNETLDIQAQNGIRIWVSNATSARFNVIGGGGRTFPVEIGATGEVVVAEIRWVRDEDGRLRVALIRMET